MGRAQGSEIGNFAAFVASPSGGLGDFAAGELVADDPVKYASDAVAQACAPGPHDAVWRSTLDTSAGRKLELAIFVDVASTSGPGGHVLTVCPVWPAGTGTSALISGGFDLSLDKGILRPTAAQRYTWSVLITPARPRSLDADPSRTFEVRSVLPFHRRLTLRARHDARSESVLLTGRLLSLGQPEPGVEIEFTESAPFGAAGVDEAFGWARTNAAGEFSIRRSVVRTREYSASVALQRRRCTAPSPAPGGCVSETIMPPFFARAAATIRERTDPKLVVRFPDRELARNANLKMGDFPPGWIAIPVLARPELCRTFDPDLSPLTATAEAHSPFFLARAKQAISISRVFGNVAQARAAFEKTATLGLVRCRAAEARTVEDTSVLHAGRLSFMALGDQTRAFRLALDGPLGASYSDIVLYRRGRTVAQLEFFGIGEPPSDLHPLAEKVAARTRG